VEGKEEDEEEVVVVEEEEWSSTDEVEGCLFLYTCCGRTAPSHSVLLSFSHSSSTLSLLTPHSIT
jgi:hypothetical protein